MSRLLPGLVLFVPEECSILIPCYFFPIPRIECAGGFFMIRKKCCMGGMLVAFGAGLLLAELLGSGFFAVLLGLLAVAGGLICMN